jgi:hypothetical protein
MLKARKRSAPRIAMHHNLYIAQRRFSLFCNGSIFSVFDEISPRSKYLLLYKHYINEWGEELCEICAMGSQMWVLQRVPHVLINDWPASHPASMTPTHHIPYCYGFYHTMFSRDASIEETVKGFVLRNNLLGWPDAED